jgi:hypothetical protein
VGWQSDLLGESYLKFMSVSQVKPLSKSCGEDYMNGGKTLGHGFHDIQGIVVSHLWVPL